MQNGAARRKSALKKKLLAAAGTSLAEMLVCTILFSLAFMVAASGLLFAYNSTTAVMKEADAQTVTDTILNRICGELAGMVKDDPVRTDNTTGNATIVAFTDSGGIPVYICQKKVATTKTDDSQLLIHYSEVTGNGMTIPASDWTFGAEAYKGYGITELLFTYGSHAGKLTVTVHLTIQSPAGKTFATKRTVWCPNQSKDNGIMQANVADITK